MRRRKASKKWSAFRNDKRGLLRHRDRQERRIGESIERMVKRETTRALRETCPYCGGSSPASPSSLRISSTLVASLTPSTDNAPPT